MKKHRKTHSRSERQPAVIKALYLEYCGRMSEEIEGSDKLDEMGIWVWASCIGKETMVEMNLFRTFFTFVILPP